MFVMSRSTPRIKISLYPIWLALLTALLLAGAGAGALVFIRGLSITNLSDLVPWGLWIAIDLSAIALSAGAFLLSAAVYLLKIKALQPVARTAVFVGLIGYSMAVMTLLLDIGRPDRFWHGLVFWNIHSPLWEVTMCVTFYLTVLLLEVLPIFGQARWLQARWPRLAARLAHIHHYAPVLAIVGLVLSTLHQSSLGSTFGVLVARPIWHRKMLAVLFFVSAAVAGPAMTVLISRLAAAVTPRARIDAALLDKVLRYLVWALPVYVVLRLVDMLALTVNPAPAREAGLALLLSGPLAVNFWLGEVLLGMALPLLILVIPGLRRRSRLQLVALIGIVGGLIAYRWNTNMVGQMVVVGYLPQQLEPFFTHYMPAPVEILAGLGIISYGLLAITLGVRYLHIVDHAFVPSEPPARQMVAAPASAD